MDATFAMEVLDKAPYVTVKEGEEMKYGRME